MSWLEFFIIDKFGWNTFFVFEIAVVFIFAVIIFILTRRKY